MNVDISRLIKISTYAKRSLKKNGEVGISRTEAYKRIQRNKVGVIVIDGVSFIDRGAD